MFKQVCDALQDSLAVLDDAGRIVAVNQPWRTFGARHGLLDPDAGLRVNYLDICDRALGADRALAQAAGAGIRGVLAGAAPGFELEYPCRSPDQKRWFLLRATRFLDSGRAFAVLVHQDITGRKRSEEALRESERRLAEAERIAHLGHYTIHPATGRAEWSAEVFRIFGLEPQPGTEPSVETYASLLHPDDVPVLNAHFRRTVEDGTPFDLTYRIRRADGDFRHVHSLARLEQASRDGAVTLFGTFQDITERKRAEAAFIEAQALTSAIMDGTSDMIWSVDAEHFGLLSFNVGLSDCARITPHFGVAQGPLA